jgi:hypothetical protein
MGLKFPPLWEPSQKGCLALFPHEHQATFSLFVAV